MINEFKPMNKKEQLEIIDLLSTISANANDCIHQITVYSSGVDTDHLSIYESVYWSWLMYSYIESKMQKTRKLITDVLLKSRGFDANDNFNMSKEDLK